MGVNSKMQVSLQITKPFQSATYMPRTGHRKILQRLLAAQISLMTKEWEATEVLNGTSYARDGDAQVGPGAEVIVGTLVVGAPEGMIEIFELQTTKAAALTAVDLFAMAAVLAVGIDA